MRDIVQMIRSGQNPQQLAMNLLQTQMSGTPLGENLINLAKQNRTADIEQIARNIMRQQGRDYDTEFKAFKQQLGL